MKVVLASIFMFIFSFQVVPVKEIGKLLFKGTMTEEIHESEFDGDEKSCEIKKEGDPYTSHRSYPNYCRYVEKAGRLNMATPVHVSKQYIPDIPTPPPNCA